MKLQRYDWGKDSMHELSYGDWCASNDVRKLEESHKELLEALKNLVLQIEQQNWGIKSPEQYNSVALSAARTVIAKAEGAQS